MVISGTQVRAARALLAWSQQQLAEASGVSAPTIKRLEARGDEIGGRVVTSEKVRTTLEAAGIVFIYADSDGGRGVRLGRRERGARKGR